MKGIAGWFVVVALLILVLGFGSGCGGGGGTSGSSGSTGSTTGTLHALQITGFTSINQMLDARNLIVGDVIQMNITGRDSKNNLVVKSVTGWTTDAPASVATLTSAGVLSAVGSSGGIVYTVQVRYGGQLYTQNLIVSAAQDLVTGLVRNTSNPIEDVVVAFYDDSKHLVGKAYTARDGTFRGSVPSTATRFTIDMSLADPAGQFYYNQYGYGDLEYLDGTTCLAKLPALSSSTPTALPDPVMPDLKNTGVPPPPPTGCIG